LAGYDFPGQTEVLATMAGINRYGMLFVAKSPHSGYSLRTLLATTHIPLREVPAALNPDLMTRKLDLLIESLKLDFGIDRPKIAISRLNPHSGEAGKLGREEKDWLQPWSRVNGTKIPANPINPPCPPDTLWVEPGRAWFSGAGQPADAYLALYHD
jgi:4-hydroxythreonine-4-phosphate dehydrogenase